MNDNNGRQCSAEQAVQEGGGTSSCDDEKDELLGLKLGNAGGSGELDFPFLHRWMAASVHALASSWAHRTARGARVARYCRRYRGRRRRLRLLRCATNCSWCSGARTRTLSFRNDRRIAAARVLRPL
jgi:hypothetical protein